jgi:isoquinoline 1-oxidoreductase subunit beta
LAAAWEDVGVIQSPIDERRYGMQFAGGSCSIPQNWQKLRQAGATARAMLVAAAAAAWNVPTAEISTENTRLMHAASGRSATYGEFAEAAARLTPPSSVNLKPVADFRLLGRRITGVDNQQIVTGQPLFGIDQRVRGMLYATYVKAPSTGGKVRSANLAHIKSLKGVKDAFVLEGNGNCDERPPSPGR